jgi:cell division septation protein DedD
MPAGFKAMMEAKKDGEKAPEKKAGDDEVAEGEKAPEAPKAEDKPEITPKEEDKEDAVTAMQKQMESMAATIKGLQDQIGATASVGQNAPFASNAGVPADPAAAPAIESTPAPMAVQASKTASSHDDADVLDSIFAAVEPAGKRGASQLTGMVRKASEVSEADLSSIWGSTPDVSSVFN